MRKQLSIQEFTVATSSATTLRLVLLNSTPMREVGHRDAAVLTTFVRGYQTQMPRTMLRCDRAVCSGAATCGTGGTFLNALSTT